MGSLKKFSIKAPAKCKTSIYVMSWQQSVFNEVNDWAHIGNLPCRRDYMHVTYLLLLLLLFICYDGGLDLRSKRDKGIADSWFFEGTLGSSLVLLERNDMSS